MVTMSEDLGPLLSECSVIYNMRYMTGSEQDDRRIDFPLTGSVVSIRSLHTWKADQSIADGTF